MKRTQGDKISSTLRSRVSRHKVRFVWKPPGSNWHDICLPLVTNMPYTPWECERHLCQVNYLFFIKWRISEGSRQMVLLVRCARFQTLMNFIRKLSIANNVSSSHSHLIGHGMSHKPAHPEKILTFCVIIFHAQNVCECSTCPSSADNLLQWWPRAVWTLTITYLAFGCIPFSPCCQWMHFHD